MWTVQPRAVDLTRDADPVVGWSRLELVERFNVADTWTLTGPWWALDWVQPGAGCILDRDGEQITSGRMWQRKRWTDPDTGVLYCRAAFVADNIGGRVVLPDHTKVLTGTPSTFSRAYDTRTAPIEDLILGYVAANLAQLATVDRRLADLVLPASLGRGGTATVNARFDNLGVLVQDLAEAGRLRVKLEHDETAGTPRLALRITEVPDVSDDIRFGIPGQGVAVLSGYGDTITAPELTRAVVAAGGELAERLVMQVVDQAAEDLWGRHAIAEQLVDQRQTTDTGEMTRAGVAALAAGASPVAVEFTAHDGPDVRVRRDYGPGYLVGVDAVDGPMDNVVREMVTTVTADDAGESTESVSVVVGTPGSSARDTTTDRRSDDALRRIELLERSA